MVVIRIRGVDHECILLFFIKIGIFIGLFIGHVPVHESGRVQIQWTITRAYRITDANQSSNKIKEPTLPLKILV